MSQAPGFYVTTAIPYVNAAPHLGHALELVQADVLARHRRLRGRPVRFLTGTDENALKNVTAAAAAGVDVATFVAANADRFAGLAGALALSFDDFIRTSSDRRHRPGVERLWRQSATRGDFYRRGYDGLYCQGCEQFYDAADLLGGLCPEHGTAPEAVTESNWFFRLSRYADDVLGALESGRVRIEPAARRNEVLSFVRAGLTDISVSRPASRAAGWGIPVPGRPRPGRLRVVGRSGELRHRPRLRHRRPWDRRHHLPGLVDRLGRTDFTEQRLLTRYHQDLGNGLGNLVNRTLSLVHRYRHGEVPETRTAGAGRELADRCAGLPSAIDRALAAFDFHAATAAICAVVAAANRLVEAERPWELAEREQAGDDAAGERLDAVLATLVEACRGLAHELSPFVPAGAARISAQVGAGPFVVATPQPVFPRLERNGHHAPTA